MLWHCWQWSCMSNLYEIPAACCTGPALLSFHCPHSNISSLVIPPNLTVWPHGQSITWTVLQLSTLATLYWKSATFFALPERQISDLCRSTTHPHKHRTKQNLKELFVTIYVYLPFFNRLLLPMCELRWPTGTNAQQLKKTHADRQSTCAAFKKRAANTETLQIQRRCKHRNELHSENKLQIQKLCKHRNAANTETLQTQKRCKYRNTANRENDNGSVSSWH